MFDFAKLNHILHAPEGYEATDAIMLTYSLNLKVLNDILQYSGITKTYFKKSKGKEFPAHVTCVMQADRAVTGEETGAYYARLLNKEGSIRKNAHANKSVHPKLLVFLYKEKGGEKQKIRLIISSRNITSSNYLEGAVCVEGIPGEKTCEQNRDMIALIKNLLSSQPLSGEQKMLLDALSCTDFSESIRNITGDEDAQYCFVSSLNEHTIEEAMPEGAEQVRIISPFLGTWEYTERFLRKAFGGNENITECDWKIITRECVQPVSLPGGCLLDGKYFYPDWYSEEEESGNIALHAKVYAFTGEAESTLMIGSANFSEKGLNINHELMLKIRSRNIDFVSLLDRADLKLEKCSLAQEPDDGLPEGAQLPPEEAAVEELIALIMSGQRTDELARFIQYVLNKTIYCDYMLDDFISCVVNAKDDAYEIIKQRALSYIEKEPEVCENPYIMEAAKVLIPSGEEA